MKRPATYLYYLLRAKRRIYWQDNAGEEILMDKMHRRFVGKPIEPAEKIQREIAEGLESGRPLMVGRIGANELANMRTYEFDDKRIEKVNRDLLCEGAGFFPNDAALMPRFFDEMVFGCKKTDYLAAWFQPFEDYYIRNIFPKDVRLTFLQYIDPFFCPENPWTRALAGKKVLVIHPNIDVIKDQYDNHRQEIFPRTDILPEFDLKLQRAVQTMAGERDERYADWFEALNAMYEEAMSTDFDVAILGCGAYGFPLAARLKCAGKQAIHLGGATQVLFGIRGRRWDREPKYKYLEKYYSDAWVRLGEKDRPKNAANVEDACYW